MKYTSTSVSWFLVAIFCITFLPYTKALASGVTLQSLSPGSTTYYGNQVVFTAVPSSFNGTVTFTASDSFPGSSVNSSSVNSGGVFGWIPTANDAGYHNITINLSDESGNTASVVQGITVIGPAGVSIQNLSPSASVNVGQTVFFSTVVTGLINPTYTVSDSFSGSLSGNAINSSGGFSWTPKVQDVGGHSITVFANDSSGHSASVVQSITVGQAVATVESLSPGSSVILKTPITFKVVATGFTNPNYYISDSLFGSSINNSNLNPSGNFAWTPGVNDLGVHNINIIVNDSSGNSVTITETITVANVSMGISGLGSGMTTINVGTPISFTASSTGFTNPNYTVSDSFSGTSVSSNNIGTSTGIFNWTPVGNDAGLHSINVHTSDNYSNNATGNVLIKVNPISVAGNAVVIPTGNTSSVKYQFNTNLAIGSSGNDVTELQKILQQKGFFSGTISGYYGEITAGAVKNFQIANNLSPVGVVGPGTRALLNGASNTNSGTPPTVQTTNSTTSKYTFTRPLALGSTGTDVTELQKKLTSLGLYSGPITGTFGPLTQTGVKKLQAKYNLEQVGNVGPGTRGILNSI